MEVVHNSPSMGDLSNCWLISLIYIANLMIYLVELKAMLAMCSYLISDHFLQKNSKHFTYWISELLLASQRGIDGIIPSRKQESKAQGRLSKSGWS
jgi:hypothetical protein